MNSLRFHGLALLILGAVLLSACGTGDHVPESIVRNRQALAASGHLLCRYQKTRPSEAAATSVWHFWRSQDRTESYDERSGQGEAWTHDPSGNIFYHRIFFEQKAMLEYHPGDLAAAGVQLSWDHLVSIIDPGLLGAAHRRADESSDGTEHYVRTLADGTREEVVWLPDLRLPLRVTHAGADAGVQDELRLLDCADSPQVSFRPVTEQEFASFRTVEFSDLGDMESDPLVRQIGSLLGGHHH